MDIVTLALARKFAVKVAAGFSSVSVDDATSTINFTLNDGKKVSLQVPTPKDGVSIVNITQDSNKHLIIALSDGTYQDAGVIPEQEIKVSKASGNALVQKEDGLYVSATGVEISEEEGNILETKEDGLYVTIDKNNPTTKQQVLEIMQDNFETEDLDFTNF